MQELPKPTAPRPYKRSPLLIGAYASFIAALFNFVMGTGMYWIVGSAGLAVLLALADIVVRVRNRGASG